MLLRNIQSRVSRSTNGKLEPLVTYVSREFSSLSRGIGGGDKPSSHHVLTNQLKSSRPTAHLIRPNTRSYSGNSKNGSSSSSRQTNNSSSSSSTETSSALGLALLSGGAVTLAAMLVTSDSEETTSELESEAVSQKQRTVVSYLRSSLTDCSKLLTESGFAAFAEFLSTIPNDALEELALKLGLTITTALCDSGATLATATSLRQGEHDSELTNVTIKSKTEEVDPVMDPLALRHDPQPWTTWELVRTGFMWLSSVTPLRIALIIPTFLTACFFARLAVIGLDRHENSAAALRVWWRAFLMRPVGWLTRLALFFAGFYSISVKGSPVSPLEAPVVVANHVSLIDPLLLYWQFNGPSFVSKDEVVHVPLLGNVMVGCGTVLLDRTCADSRGKVQRQINQRVSHNISIAEGHKSNLGESYAYYNSLVIFPEGTTTTGSALIDFKLGAFRPMCPVQPVTIKYPHNHFNPTYASDKSGISVVLRTLSQVINYAEIEYLPVMYPNGEELALASSGDKNETNRAAQLYADRVRIAMAKSLGCRLVTASPY